ncbi:putative F-box protein At4g21240 [Raphanus sativus]|uniref:F-box protein At4g21240 n=1 Tax=Raphanus sativus TaxID=3726 RepID=A0A6J0NVM1_RAPSA|nr:putative F-box protein At4g21240 [Raphanus sativus]
MTTTPSFIKSFSVHSSARPSLLFFKNEEENCVFYSLPHHPPAEKYLPKEETGLLPRIKTNANYQSIHGLIPFRSSKSVMIWNPTLKQHVTLPEPKVSKPLISLLGYDPIGDEYKVLCMSLWNKRENPQIFTLGPRESWRTLIQGSPSRVKFYKGVWRCINGVVYYLAVDNTIVSFDVRSEKFGVIQIPELPCRIERLLCGFVRHRGRLALFSNFSSFSGQISLWILEDAEKHEWSLKDSYLPYVNGSNTLSFFALNGETIDDELIYLPMFAVGPLYAIYYDLERNRVRKVEYEYEGFGDIEFRSHCFPNHIESLMSLNDLLLTAA